MNLPVVAVLGLGAMGHAFASNLLKNGFTVHGWNRSPERGDDLLASGLIRHATPQQAVESAEVILSVLTDAQATLQVIQQIAPGCREGVVFCQMGTIGVEETREAIGLLESLSPSSTYLDAPVSGTKNRPRMRKFWYSPAAIVSEARRPSAYLPPLRAARNGLVTPAAVRK